MQRQFPLCTSIWRKNLSFESQSPGSHLPSKGLSRQSCSQEVAALCTQARQPVPCAVQRQGIKSQSLNYSTLLKIPAISQNWKHCNSSNSSKWSEIVNQASQVLTVFSAECILPLHPAYNYGVFWLWSFSPLKFYTHFCMANKTRQNLCYKICIIHFLVQCPFLWQESTLLNLWHQGQLNSNLEKQNQSQKYESYMCSSLVICLFFTEALLVAAAPSLSSTWIIIVQ